eukprot:scaffold48345_cov58-Phaeocystis_antarctica.AAC.6
MLLQCPRSSVVSSLHSITTFITAASRYDRCVGDVAATQVERRELLAPRGHRHHRHVRDVALPQVERRELLAPRSYRHHRRVGDVVAVTQFEATALTAALLMSYSSSVVSCLQCEATATTAASLHVPNRSDESWEHFENTAAASGVSVHSQYPSSSVPRSSCLTSPSASRAAPQKALLKCAFETSSASGFPSPSVSAS